MAVIFSVITVGITSHIGYAHDVTHYSFRPLRKANKEEPFFMDIGTITNATKNLPSPNLIMKIGNLVLRAFFSMNNFNFHIQFFNFAT